MRTKAFSVRAQVAQPSERWRANQRWTASLNTWLGSDSAIRTFTSSRAITLVFIAKPVHQLRRHQARSLPRWQEPDTISFVRRALFRRQRPPGQFRNDMAGASSPVGGDRLRAFQHVFVNIQRRSHRCKSSRIEHQTSTTRRQGGTFVQQVLIARIDLIFAARSAAFTTSVMIAAASPPAARTSGTVASVMPPIATIGSFTTPRT
jgi:hypothetical protein